MLFKKRSQTRPKSTASAKSRPTSKRSESFGQSWLYLIQDGVSNRYKIGITSSLPHRIEQIQEEVPKARYTLTIRIWNAYRNEQRLHWKWGSERFTHKGSGRTEWFRFNWLELTFVFIDFFHTKYLRLNGLIWWRWI
ncbi:MAG: GIY-YIG nuclease family protein [Phaeodactylibacter sp.]|nr:GIY-YIG nuclease family protein [Bdellovibrionales bacterium]MCB0642915.1 GIY-YIG nuclease family protein [Phaeodactylibacter sp.]